MTLNRVQKWQQKVEWMIAHRDLWAHVSNLRYVSSGQPPLYLSDRPTWRAIVDGLKDDGLISRKTGTIDVKVRELIRDAQITPVVEPEREWSQLELSVKDLSKSTTEGMEE